MQKYLKKRLEELKEKEKDTRFMIERSEDNPTECKIHESMLRELVIRISETEQALSYCKENRKPILVDVETEMAKIELYMSEIDPEINSDSKHYRACSIAYNALLQLQILQRD